VPVEPSLPALTGIYVEGFKSFAPLNDDERAAAYDFMAKLDAADRGEGEFRFTLGDPVVTKGWYPIRPLTVLCGPNTNGKSSLTQGLLLLKQTAAVPAGRPDLLARGDLVEFETYGEMLFQPDAQHSLRLGAGVRKAVEGEPSVAPPIENSRAISTFRISGELEARLESTEGFDEGGKSIGLLKRVDSGSSEPVIHATRGSSSWSRYHAWPPFLLWVTGTLGLMYPLQDPSTPDEDQKRWWTPATRLFHALDYLLLVAGRRSVGVRRYSRFQVEIVPGARYDQQFASILAHWQATGDARLEQVRAAMEELGLAQKVDAKVVSANDVEIQVNAGLGNGHDRNVNLALVGLGVSAALPVVTALIHAQKNQTVIIEEPEMHLHPKGQAAMADLIVAAAKRGVRVIVETHSDIMLLRMQTLLAKGELKPGDSVFHWFEKNGQGATEVQSVFPDAAGRVGAWLNDFATIRAHANDDYLDASFERLTGERTVGQHE
jgi:hypothetical protein